MQPHALVRAIIAVVLVGLVAGCARGIVHSMDATEATDVTTPSTDASVDVSVDAAPAIEEAGADASVVAEKCEDTKTDEACFDCCDSKLPTGYDAWFASFDACCPDDECTDEEWDKCEVAADDACTKDPACLALERCEEVCWEKPSSGE